MKILRAIATILLLSMIAAGFSGCDWHDYRKGTTTVTDGNVSLPDDGDTTPPPATGTIPPDPSTLAPALSPTESTLVSSSTAFLYSGSTPIQTGVADGTIDPAVAAVVRGKVLSRDGSPLSGVTVTVLNHPEYGQTLSRADGMFDLAVNGGTTLTVNYTKTGYLSLQRTSVIPELDFTVIDAVVMTPASATATTVDLAHIPDAYAVAQGSVSSDDRGTRRSTLLFPQGTQAQLKLPDGSTQPITSLTLRITEYTTGEEGEDAMPAELPEGVGYTYCVEMSVDEAEAHGATSVLFDTPVINYVENFMGFAVGSNVPSYYYDRAAGQWVTMPFGRVIKVLSITDGKADLDTNGDGVADNNASLGITDAERETIATLYPANSALWRVALEHFTPVDYNGWAIPPEDDTLPDLNEMDQIDTGCPPGTARGSIIECQSQVLGETVSVAGTPLSLNYRSNRTEGGNRKHILDIPLTKDNWNGDLAKIKVRITVAGQSHDTEYTEFSSDLFHHFVWDGLDAYGREVYGTYPVQVRIIYEYWIPYLFGDRWILEVALKYRRWNGYLEKNPVSSLGTDGWTLNLHHRYDGLTKTLYLGTGEETVAEQVSPTIVKADIDNTYASYVLYYPTSVYEPSGMDCAPDGSCYIAARIISKIQKLNTDGSIITVVSDHGTDYTNGYSGDGGAATDALLDGPMDVAYAPDGSLYIADFYNYRIRKVDPNGIITTIAGTGTYGYSGDGGPATKAQIGSVNSLDVASDGTVYFTDDSRIRRIGTDGIITTIAGTDSFGDSGDGDLAINAQIGYSPRGLTVAPDGSLYFAQTDQYGSAYKVRKIDPGGTIKTVAGTGVLGDRGDFGPATEASLSTVRDLAVANDGTLYIGESTYVRKVDHTGTIYPFAGNGSSDSSGDGSPALEAAIYLYSMALAPDGSLYIGDRKANSIRRIKKSHLIASQYTLLSPDRTQLYAFDETGRHLQTLDVMTGTPLYTFDYNTEGLLVGITDDTNHTIGITRNAAGVPTVITPVNGQQTGLNTDSNGHLSQISNPLGEAWSFVNTDDGLVTQITKPHGHASSYEFDEEGALVKATDAAGGWQTLSRIKTIGTEEVRRQTSMGRTTRYISERLENGQTRDLLITPDGLKTETLHNASIGITSHITNYPDGTTVSLTQVSDPRFRGMAGPFNRIQSTTTPAGLKMTLNWDKTFTLADETDPFSLRTETKETRINGRVFTHHYDATANALTYTSPEGRSVSTTLDGHGRPTQISMNGMEPSLMEYDLFGRIQTMGRGTRLYHFTYGSDGYLSGITDPLNNTVTMTHDAAGRLTQKTFPGGRTVRFGYDAMGNLVSVTPPSKPAHDFIYTLVDEIESYDPPVSSATTYSYNADHQLTGITRPDGSSLGMAYNSATGRLLSITTPSKTINYTYDTGSGYVLKVAASTETLNLAYDGMLQTGQTWSGTVNGSVNYAYDNNFHVVSLAVNGANPVSFTYDDDGMITGAGAMTLTRSAESGLLSATALGSVSDSYAYNGYNELSDYTASFVGTPIFETAYVRNAVGRITQKTETVGGSTSVYDYSYDTSGRLTGVSKNSVAVESYTYDDNGNRLSANGESASYDDEDKLTALGSTAYTYTANGELLTKTDGSGTTTYTYDFFGNLTHVALPDGTPIDYVIDGANRRIGKMVHGSLVQGFLYQNGLNPVAELDNSGSVVSRFIYGSKKNVPDYMVKAGNTYRIVSDYLGSVRLVLNTSDGTIAQRIDYDTWGNVVSDTAPGFQPFGFAGGLYDNDTKLIRFGLRDYDAQSGRWTMKDPISFAGKSSNLYSYAQNDPVNFIDITGLRYCPPTIDLPTSLNDAAIWSLQRGLWSEAPEEATTVGGAAITALGISLTVVGTGTTMAFGEAVGVAVGVYDLTVTATTGMMNAIFGDSWQNWLSNALLGEDDTTSAEPCPRNDQPCRSNFSGLF